MTRPSAVDNLTSIGRMPEDKDRVPVTPSPTRPCGFRILSAGELLPTTILPRSCIFPVLYRKSSIVRRSYTLPAGGHNVDAPRQGGASTGFARQGWRDRPPHCHT